MPAVSIAVRCNYCSKQQPRHRVHQLQAAQLICDDCIDWHNKAIETMTTGIAHGCQGCGLTREHLIGADNLRMYVVPKDGIYQLLCFSCMTPYLLKRTDLYKGTPFGHQALKI